MNMQISQEYVKMFLVIFNKHKKVMKMLGNL